LVGFNLLNFWNWSELSDKNVGNLLAQVVEVIGSNIHDDSSDVGLDFVHVHNGVLEHLGEKSNWVLEDGCPDLDSFNVWLNTFAILEISVDGADHLSDDGNSLDDVRNIFLSKISNSFSKLNLECLSISETWLDGIKIVVLNKTVKKTCHKLHNLIVVEPSNGGSCKSFGDWNSKIRVSCFLPVNCFVNIERYICPIDIISSLMNKGISSCCT